MAGSQRRSRRAETERLLAAAGRIARLRSLHDAIAASASDARELVRAAAGLCVATGTDGRWLGVVVDGEGAQALDEDAVAAVRTLAAAVDDAGCIDVDGQPIATRLALPPTRSLVLAPAGDDAPVPLVLGALDDRPLGLGAAGLLARFTTAAALAVGNARLFEQIESAYRQQLDLNRQKDEFVATVSHELRTPLAAMRAAIDMVQRFGERIGADRQAELLSGAAGHGEHLERLIEDLLLVAATEQADVALATAEVDVRSLLDDVVAATAAAADQRVVVIDNPVLRTIRTDRHKLRAILEQLVGNAAKFAPEGAIELEPVAAGSRALFYVSDHGPGVRPADRRRIFDRFVQLDQSLTREHGGLGLGLYLAQQLARALGGEIVVTDAPGGGACFCLAVERTLEAPAAADRSEQATGAR